MKLIFICTSNADRSPALEKYFKEKYPCHQFRSAGVNEYHTKKKGTHFLTQGDIAWSNIIVYAEDIHQLIAHRHYTIDKKQEIVLNLGHYEHLTEEYPIKAEAILKSFLQPNTVAYEKQTQ